MFFRRRKTPAPSEPPAWSAAAVACEFEPLAAEAEESLRAELAVDTGRVERLHVLRRDGQPELLAFDHVRPVPGGRAPDERRFRMVLRDEGPVSPASWRAFPRSHPLIASLQASRTGGELVESGDAAFDARVVIIARDVTPIATLLTEPVRAALLELLGDELPAATATCGARHLGWRLHRETDPPFRAVETVAARLLRTWAALRAVRRSHGTDEA